MALCQIAASCSGLLGKNFAGRPTFHQPVKTEKPITDCRMESTGWLPGKTSHLTSGSSFSGFPSAEGVERFLLPIRLFPLKFVSKEIHLGMPSTAIQFRERSEGLCTNTSLATHGKCACLLRENQVQVALQAPIGSKPGHPRSGKLLHWPIGWRRRAANFPLFWEFAWSRK